MAGLYTRIASKVVDLLTRFGATGTLTRPARTVDGATGTVTEGAASTWVSPMVLTSQKDSFANAIRLLSDPPAGASQQVAQGALVVLVPGNVSRPEAGDRIDFSGRNLVVMDCTVVAPDGATPLLYKAGVKDA